MYKLAIIIINYNSPEDTLECLWSLEKFALDMQPLVLLYDNSDLNPLNSDQLSDFHLNIIFKRNGKNMGFAGAVNEGLAYLQHRDFTHFFLLNNDVVLVDDSLRKMMKFMQENGEVQIAGGVNYYYEQTDKIWQAGFNNKWCTGGVEHVVPQKNAMQVDYVPGSTLLAKVSLISKVGFLDEQFFHYFEENDFCLRAAKIGKVMVLGETRFLHKADNRDRKDSPFIFYYMTRNYLLFLKKHRVLGKRVFSSFYFLVYNFFRAIKYDVIGKERTAFTFFSSYNTAIWHYFIGKKGQYANLKPQKRST